MLYNPERFLLIAGPCSLENRDICLRVAEELTALGSSHKNLQVIFKGSFDKANRTDRASDRGPGLEEGLKLLSLVKETFNLPVLTDIHLPEQAALVSGTCDVLQIPAFLCRQTDLLVAAGETNSVVNIKKGQFLAPGGIQFAVEKVRSTQPIETWVTERGSSFGYNNLVVDMRAIPIMRKIATPVIIDASHGVQLPGAGGSESSGDCKYIPTIARAGITAGADGLFLETHPNPMNAISDKKSQWPLENFRALALSCLRLWDFLRQEPHP